MCEKEILTDFMIRMDEWFGRRIPQGDVAHLYRCCTYFRFSAVFTEKILDRPPREEDWWVNAKSPPGEGGAVTSDESFDSSTECCDQTAKSRISSSGGGGGGGGGSTSSPAHSSNSCSAASDTSNSSSSSRRFRNRGLETWEVARNAWRQPCVEENMNTKRRVPYVPTRSDPPSPAVRKKLVQNVARDRQYTLPRQMPLSEIMSVYQEIWHGENGGEC
jgi:hypothetical protein